MISCDKFSVLPLYPVKAPRAVARQKAHPGAETTNINHERTIKMKASMNRLMAGAAAGLLVLTACAYTSRAESPVREITLQSQDFVLNPATGEWIGTLVLTIDGCEYEGTGVWQITKLQSNKNSIHAFAVATYYFGELGSFDIWDHTNMDWGIVEPAYRLSPFTAIERTTSGTGAFANAHGVFHVAGTLEAQAGALPVVSFSGGGMIYGIDLE
jgi:hypothetical protein